MITVLLLAAVAATCHATPVYVREPVAYAVSTSPVIYKEEAPKPYSFGYEAPAIGGGSSRHETADGSGRVVGSYTVTDADGRVRVVDYYADETGFHANVKTNEPGTANQDSADVSVQSYSAPVAAPAVAPKVVAAAPIVAAPVVAAAPVYSYARVVPRRMIAAPAPIAYRVAPAYNRIAYAPAPVAYGYGYFGHHGVNRLFYK